MVLASSSARGRISALAIVFFWVGLFGIGTARGELTPESERDALAQSSHLIFPLSVRLSNIAELSLQYAHRAGHDEFSAQIRRVPAPLWMRPLTWSADMYVLDTDFWSPYGFVEGRAATGTARAQSRTFLNPLLPIGSTLRKITSDFVENPAAATQWTLQFSDGTRKAKLRRWILEFLDPHDGYSGITEVKGEFEVRNEQGDMVLIEAPVLYKEAKSRILINDESIEEWEGRFIWRPQSRFGMLPRLQIWTSARAEFVRLKPRSANLFSHADSQNLLLSILRMERESFPARPLSTADLKKLGSEEKTQALVAKNVPVSSYPEHWTAYLIYTEHTDHFEIRSLGCLEVYRNLGVVPQLLKQLASFSKGKKYIVANLPPEQWRWLAEAGFAPWPNGAPIRSDWKNLRDDEHGSELSTGYSTGDFRLGVENSGIWAQGKLPVWAREGATPAKPAPNSGYNVEYNPDDKSADDVSNFANASPYEPVADAHTEYFANYSHWEESQEDRPWVLKDLDVLEKLLEEVRSASTPQEKETIAEKIRTRYSKSEISSINKQWYMMGIPFTAYELFLSSKMRLLAREIRMRALVMDYLNRLDAAAGHPGHYELRMRLVDLMNDLRRILQPQHKVIDFERVERVARYFADNGDFPPVPSYTVNLRGKPYSLASLNVPPQPEYWISPRDIYNVLMITEAPGKGRFAAVGDLRAEGDDVYAAFLRTGENIGRFSSELFKRHAWMEMYVGVAKSVRLHPSQKVYSPSARVILRELEKLPEPKEPLHVGFFLVDAAHNKELYVVLSSQDPNWHMVVVNADLIEPVDPDSPSVNFLEVNSSLNCDSVILNAKRVMDVSRNN